MYGCGDQWERVHGHVGEATRGYNGVMELRRKSGATI
jgi:hypothetical protein